MAARPKRYLRKCVHCGFCTATCPTYQLLGDELDGPRGRIYLMKQVLEGAEPTRKTQMHLDRCLTCRNCETTCPSGVDYGHLIDIGRKIVDEKVPRPAAEKAVRWLLKEGLPSPLFGPAMKLGQLVRPLMPAALEEQGAGQAGCRCLAHADPCAQGVDAGGLCAAGHDAQHQHRHRARAGRRGHPDRGRAQGGLLRRGEVSPERPGRRQGRNARQHRRLVAPYRKRCRSHRDERLGLWRHGERIRPHPGRRPGLCGQGRAHQRAHPRPERVVARAGAGVETQAGAGARRQARWWAFTRPARCNTASNSRAAWSNTWARWVSP